MPEWMGIYISQDGYQYLTDTLGFIGEDYYYFDPEENCWYVNYVELMDFLERNNLEWDDSTSSIYWANMQPSQKAIFIGVN